MHTYFKYDHYFDYEEMMTMIHYFKKQYPLICSTEVICKTQEGRDVVAVTLSLGNPSHKKAFYVDGNTHAGEVSGSIACLHLMDVLLTNYETDKDIYHLLDTTAFYIIPRISPDGAETYLKTPYMLRSVNRPYYKEFEGVLGEDINQDGNIVLMQVPSPFGVWKKDPNHPELMIKREPNDIDGDFYNIYDEGMIYGEVSSNIKTANARYGLDFNRNYPFGWFSEVRQAGAGPYPLSNPETKAVIDFVLAHPNIDCVLTHHTSGGMILCPPGTRPEKTMSALDKKVIRELAEVGKKYCDYDVVQIFDAFMQDQEHYSSGAFDDWCYQEQGIPAYTVEIWNVQKEAGIETSWPPKPKTDLEKAEDYLKLVSWVKQHQPEAFIPWTSYNHPQLGAVEIGGIVPKYTMQNPPCAFLENEMTKLTKMTIEMAKTLPSLYFVNVKATPIQDDLYQLEITIGNKGYLPTYLTTQANEMKVSQPLTCHLETDGKVISVKDEHHKHLEGFSGIFSDYGFYNISTENHNPCTTKLTMIIQGHQVKVTVGNGKTGFISRIFKF